MTPQQVTKAVAIDMVSRFTAIKNRFIFRLRKIVGGELPLETETCRFVLISLLDLFMTFLLLYFSNRGMMRNVVVESNPVARYFISGWGTTGLVWFKISEFCLRGWYSTTSVECKLAVFVTNQYNDRTCSCATQEIVATEVKRTSIHSN